jgi:hypothetical protein
LNDTDQARLDYSFATDDDDDFAAEADAANDDGEAALLAVEQAEREAGEARAAAAVKAFAAAVNAAQEAAGKARQACQMLAEADFDFDEGAGLDAKRHLAEAGNSLYAVAKIAGTELKTVTDAEKDVELERLRVRVAELEIALAAKNPVR